MNKVFITGPVGSDGRGGGARLKDLRQILPHVVAAGLGGVAAASALAAVGRLARRVDPTSRATAMLLVVLAAAALVIWLQLRGRVSPLPERRRQVPRRWLRWRRRWLTAAAYGFVLGAGGFTHLRQASMYALALMMLVSPSVLAAAAVGGIYGLHRGSTVLFAWHRRRRGRRDPGLADARLWLALAALATPLWALYELAL